MKRTLPETLFMLILEYGANLFGYWGYDNMIEQFEDCIDVFHKLYSTTHDNIWLFDQSSGHTKSKDNGLNVERR